MILNFAFFVAEGAGRPRPGTLIPSFFITFFLFSILKKFPLSKKNVFDKNDKKEIKCNDVKSENLIKNKVAKKRIISKGWIRLHILLSFFVPIFLSLVITFSHLVIVDGFQYAYEEAIIYLDYNFWVKCLIMLAFLFVFYWIVLLLFWLTLKFKKSIITLRGFVLNIIVSFLLIPILLKVFLSEFFKNSLELESGDEMFLFNLTFYIGFNILYWLSVLIYIWVRRGFIDS